MELKSHHSKHLHDLFLARFKGKIACIDKHGQLGQPEIANHPVEKTLSSTPRLHLAQQTPTPTLHPLDSGHRREPLHSVGLGRNLTQGLRASHSQSQVLARCAETVILNPLKGNHNIPDWKGARLTERIHLAQPRVIESLAKSMRHQSLPRLHQRTQAPAHVSLMQPQAHYRPSDPPQGVQPLGNARKQAHPDLQRVGYLSLSNRASSMRELNVFNCPLGEYRKRDRGAGASLFKGQDIPEQRLLMFEGGMGKEQVKRVLQSLDAEL